VSPLLCRGVSSLYCAYRGRAENPLYGKQELLLSKVTQRCRLSAIGDAAFFELPGLVSYSLIC
jgi:hypothetical protein